MNLLNFFLIDGGLILLGLAIILIFKKEVKTLSTSRKDKGKLLEQDSINLPSRTQLLELEKTARTKGSNIEFDSLIGLWNFVSVWKKQSDEEDLISSSLLRLFSASLELKNEENYTDFSITNSIQFGLLSIRFNGLAKLKGKQPLLIFFFKNIELKFASNILISRDLEIPGESNMPFFALIAKDKSNKWLSARGRGGGLAIWAKA